MVVTLVHVVVKPGHIEDFIEASVKNHQQSVKEPGNMRFDFLQDANEPSKFVLYEAYIDKEHAAKHKATAHYSEWRETVADWMMEPRVGVPYLGICP